VGLHPVQQASRPPGLARARVERQQDEPLALLLRVQPVPDAEHGRPVIDHDGVEQGPELRLDRGRGRSRNPKEIGENPADAPRRLGVLEQPRHHGRPVAPGREHRGEAARPRRDGGELSLELGQPVPQLPLPVARLPLGDPLPSQPGLELRSKPFRLRRRALERPQLRPQRLAGRGVLRPLLPSALQLTGPFAVPLPARFRLRARRADLGDQPGQLVACRRFLRLERATALAQELHVGAEAGGARAQLRERAFHGGCRLRHLGPLRREALPTLADPRPLGAERVEARPGGGDPLVGEHASPFQLLEPPADLLQARGGRRAGALALDQVEAQGLDLGLLRREARLLLRPCPTGLGESGVHLSEASLDRPQPGVGDGDLELQPALAQLTVLPGPPPLAGEGAHLARDLAEHVVEPPQVLLRLLEPSKRRPPPVLVAAYLSRFLEQGAPLLRPVAEDRVDHPALDDRVRVRPETGVPAQILDVLEPDALLVERVDVLAAAQHGPADRDLRVRDRQDPVLVRQLDRDLRPVDRLPPGRSLEDRLLHAAPADRGRALLAEHPAQGVGDVRLPAAVGPDDRGDPLVEVDAGAVGERLETVELEGADLHRGRPRRVTSRAVSPASLSSSPIGVAASSDSNAPA
jgi:hypothetical protein